MENTNWKEHVPAGKRWLLSGPVRRLGRMLGRLDAIQRELEFQYILEPIFHGPGWDAEKRRYRDDAQQLRRRTCSQPEADH
mgnify:CR=1 FL=1